MEFLTPPKGEEENQAHAHMLRSSEEADTCSPQELYHQTQAQFRKGHPSHGGSSYNVFVNTDISSECCGATAGKRRGSHLQFNWIIQSFAETGGKDIYIRFKDCQKSKMGNYIKYA